MRRDLGGDAARLRAGAERRVGRALGLRPDDLSPAEAKAYRAMAPALDAIPDLSRWPREDRDALAAIVRAKAARDERRYLRFMQRHRAFAPRGSAGVSPELLNSSKRIIVGSVLNS